MKNILQHSKKSVEAAGKRLVMLIIVVLCASTQIYAQTGGVTIGDTSMSGASMLNIKPTPNGPGLSVGDSNHIAQPAPPNGASIQGQLLIGTTNLGTAKVIVDGTGHIIALQVQGGVYLTQPDKSFIFTSLSGNCWLLGVEEQEDGLTAIPKLYKVSCPP